MSLIVSTPLQINQSPHNDSTAKHMYSFGKSKRFGRKRGSQNEKISYEIPTTKSNRSAAFGYGNRYSMVGKSNSPPPGSYEGKSQFNKIPVGKAFSFGISRAAYGKVYLKEQPPPDKAIPGPGQYQINGTFGNSGLQYSLRPRTGDNIFSQRRKKSPGPGTYDPKSTIDK